MEEWSQSAPREVCLMPSLLRALEYPATNSNQRDRMNQNILLAVLPPGTAVVKTLRHCSGTCRHGRSFPSSAAEGSGVCSHGSPRSGHAQRARSPPGEKQEKARRQERVRRSARQSKEVSFPMQAPRAAEEGGG